MKKMVNILFIFCVSLATLSFAKEFKYAVVDMSKLATEAKVFKSVQSQAKSLKDATDKKFQKEIQALQDEDKKLRESANNLSPTELKNKQKSLQVRYTNLQKNYRSDTMSLQKSVMSAERKIQEKLSRAVKDVAAGKYEIVLTSNATLYYDSAKDITKTVIKKLDSVISRVTISI